MSLLDDEEVMIESNLWDDFKSAAILDGIKYYLEQIKAMRYSFDVSLDNMITAMNRLEAKLKLDISEISEIGHGKRYFIGYDYTMFPKGDLVDMTIKFKLFDSEKYAVKRGIIPSTYTTGGYDISKKNQIGNYKIFSVFEHQPKIHKTDHPMKYSYSVLDIGIKDTNGGWLTYTIEDLVNKTANKHTVELKEYELD
jgi:hypothetical protein